MHHFPLRRRRTSHRPALNRSTHPLRNPHPIQPVVGERGAMQDGHRFHVFLPISLVAAPGRINPEPAHRDVTDCGTDRDHGAQNYQQLQLSVHELIPWLNNRWPKSQTARSPPPERSFRSLFPCRRQAPKKQRHALNSPLNSITLAPTPQFVLLTKTAISANQDPSLRLLTRVTLLPPEGW